MPLSDRDLRTTTRRHEHRSLSYTCQQVCRPLATPALVLGTAMLTSCQTLDQAVKKTQQANEILATETVQSLLGLARSEQPREAARQALNSKIDAYSANPELLIRDIRKVKRDYRHIMAVLAGKVEQRWGKQESRLPDRKTYVKYTQNYASRAVVDFDSGRITIETLDDNRDHRHLHNAIVTTLLTPQDPRSVDLFSSREVTLDGRQPPYLLNLVVDKQGRAISTPAQAETFARRLIGERLRQRTITSPQGRQRASFVTIQMVSNFSHRQAIKYRPLVERFAGKYDISKSLVYAIIKTESNFNPFAVSHVPAYGLMQLVPSSGGQDAYRHARGKQAIPSKQFLFDPSNNIELGTAYLDVLDDNYLAGIKDPVAREYCVIAAYNTGSGNVFKAFAQNRKEAQRIINELRPGQVFARLKSQLPHQETRRYLDKVVQQRKHFVSL